MRATLAIMVAVLITASAWCAKAAAPETPAIAVRQVVLDIISFTRWPAPPPAFRLCVIGQAEFAGALFADDLRVRGTAVIPDRRAASDTRIGAECDVVYEGPLPATERTDVARSIAGYPVLTIGEAASGCIETTMFCLQITAALAGGAQVSGAQVPFSTNLDAIARSGVRLNPRVLLLGRRPTATTVPQ